MTASRPKNAGYRGIPACMASHSSGAPSSNGNDAMSRTLFSRTRSNSRLPGTSTRANVSRHARKVVSRSRGACVADVVAAGQWNHSKAQFLCLPGLQRQLRDGAVLHAAATARRGGPPSDTAAAHADTSNSMRSSCAATSTGPSCSRRPDCASWMSA